MSDKIEYEMELDINDEFFEKMLPSALKQMALETSELMKELADPRTPKKFGNLRAANLPSNVVEVEELVVEGGLENSLDYAPRVHEIEFKNYTTSGTGSKFFEKTIEQDSDKLVEKAVDVFNEVIE